MCVQYTGVQATWYNESANTYATKAVDLSGGFYNDGDVGPVKLTWNIALTTSMLAWSMLEYPEYWAADVERKNLVASVLRHGAAYISETYVVNPLRNPLDPERAAQSSYDLLYYVVRVYFYLVFVQIAAFLIFGCEVGSVFLS